MFVSIQGKKVWYTEAGKGPTVVLLHGYLESSGIWDSFAEKLSSVFRVISIDLPGHGQSEVHGETHSMEFIAGVIKNLLDNVGAGRVFLIGHSLGGYVALAFLEFFPDDLAGYCLFHSHPLPDTPEATEKRKREISFVRAGKKDLMYPENIERMFATPNLEKFPRALIRSKQIASDISGEGIIAVLNGMMIRPSRLALMEDGKVPCLWILGKMDNYIPVDTVQQKVHLPVNARVVILEQSGHMGFIEEADLSFSIIADFAGSLQWS